MSMRQMLCTRQRHVRGIERQALAGVVRTAAMAGAVRAAMVVAAARFHTMSTAQFAVLHDAIRQHDADHLGAVTTAVKWQSLSCCAE